MSGIEDLTPRPRAQRQREATPQGIAGLSPEMRAVAEQRAAAAEARREDPRAFAAQSQATVDPLSREQITWGAAAIPLNIAPGAGVADAFGYAPSITEPGEYYPSMRENLREGNYADVLYQGLGLGADAATALLMPVPPLAGVAAGAGVGIRSAQAARRAAQQTEQLSIASAFSGAGTVEAAMPAARSVFAAENDPIALSEFNRIHGTEYDPRDATRLDPAEIAESDPALFHASPVCKNFSCAKTLRGAQETDRQSAESVARVITEARPPAVSIENVPQYQNTAMYERLVDSLEESGYRWDAQIINSADYGGVQNRNRLILRAVRGDAELPPLPEKTGPGDWYASVQDLIADAPPATLGNVETQRINSMIDRGLLDPAKPIISMGGSAFRNTWAASNAGGPAPTLKSTPNEVPRIILPGGDARRVTSRMMARLMSLPDTFPVPDRPQLAKQILGNGVEGNISRLFLEPLARQGQQIKQSERFSDKDINEPRLMQRGAAARARSDLPETEQFRQATERTRALLARVAPRLQVPVRAHVSVEDARRTTGYEDIPDNAGGFATNDEIHLIAGANPTEEALEKALWHEITHAGVIRQYLPESQEFFQIMQRLSDANPKVQKSAALWKDKNTDLFDSVLKEAGGDIPRVERWFEARAVEEALAELSEGGKFRFEGARAFIGQVTELMRKIGLETLANRIEGMTDGEAIRFIVKARKATERPRIKPLSPKEQTRNLKNFLGNSVVRGVVYHGTPSDFKAFEVGDLGFHVGTQEQANTRLRNLYDMRSSTASRDRPGRPYGEGDQVMPVYIRLENPLRMDDVGEFRDALTVNDFLPDEIRDKVNPARIEAAAEASMELNPNGAGEGAGFQAFLASPENISLMDDIRDVLRREGYDGVVYENLSEGAGDSYIVLDPGRIKSATGNEGTFNPVNMDIRFMNIGRLADQAVGVAPYSEVQNMLDAGESAEEIAKKTGWFQLNDGMWRVRITDKNAALDKNATLLAFPGALAYKITWPLEAALDHPELFAAYPELKKFNFGAFEPVGRLKNVWGYFDPDTKTIRVSSDNLLNYQERALSTTLHELQHAVQQLEGFYVGQSALGSSPKYFTAQEVANAEKELNRDWFGAYQNLSSSFKEKELSKKLYFMSHGESEARVTQAQAKAERQGLPVDSFENVLFAQDNRKLADLNTGSALTKPPDDRATNYTSNSIGLPLAADGERLREFAAFFRGSKVTDSAGRPLLVKKTNDGVSYAETRTPEDGLSYLSIKNPLVMRESLNTSSGEKMLKSVMNSVKSGLAPEAINELKQINPAHWLDDDLKLLLFSHLERYGYDGIVFQKGRKRRFIPFENRQAANARKNGIAFSVSAETYGMIEEVRENIESLKSNLRAFLRSPQNR